MTEKTIKVPGPDHPITVEPAKARVVVTVAGKVIADSRRPSCCAKHRIRRYITFRATTSR